MKKLGILGGTFDPIHFGHLRTAEEVCHSLNLHKVFLIPSASPPHKTEDPVTAFSHRLVMTELAIGEDSSLRALDMEGKRSGPSYSIETLREFHHRFSDPELYFIVGTDAFLEIDTWKEYRRLFDYAHFVIIQRPGFQKKDLEGLIKTEGLTVHRTEEPHTFTAPSGNRLIFMTTTVMDISSTQIRRLVSRMESIRYLVPDAVRSYILREGLYQDHGKFG